MTFPDGGLAHVADQLDAQAQAQMAWMAIGTGTGAETAGDTALGTEVHRKACTVTNNGSQVTYVTTFGVGEGSGDITEIGIFNAASGGTLLERKRIATVTKGTNDSKEFTLTLTLSSGGIMAAFTNKLINPDFAISQRGESFSSPSDAYVMDRWVADVGSGSGTISRQPFTLGQLDVPGEPEFFARFIQATNSTGQPSFEQRVEDVRTLAGKEVTLSVYMRVSSGSLTVNPRITQSFGSGGSSDTPTTAGSFSLTTSWQRFSYTVTLDGMSGKTIGAGSYVAAEFLMPASNTYTVEIANVQLESGPVATEFEKRPIGLEQMLCERYYERFTAPGSNCWFPASGGGLNATQSWVTYAPMVAKRAVPTVAVNDINDFRLTSITSLTEFFITSIAISANATERGFALSLNGTGLPDNDIIALRLDAVDAWIEFDAEL